MWYASILIYQEKKHYFFKKKITKKNNIMGAETKGLAGVMPAIGIGMDIANTVGGYLIGNERQENQYKYQRKLNEQMAQIQRDNWDYTNAENQRKHYEKAGLNVGLMYGGSGTGGATMGGGSGGSVGMPETPKFMGMGIQGAIAESQIELNKAQADKLKAEAEKTRGIDTELGKTQVASLTQGINNQKAEEELTYIMQDVNKLGMEEAKERIIALGIENNINSNVINEKIKIVQNEAVKGVLENALLKSQNENTQQMTKESKARINKMTEDIAQGWANLSIQEKQTKLKEFESNLKAEYPSIGESAGRLVNELQLGLETLFGVREERYHRNTKEQK